MAHSQEKKMQARSLFVHSRLTQSVIAIKLDVSTATVNRWKAAAREGGDDWEMAQSADMVAGEGFEKLVSKAVEDFTIMFQVTMNEIQDTKDMNAGDKAKMMASLADSFNKMINSAGRAAPSLSKLGIATDVLQRMANFIRENFPEHQEAFLEILEPFGIDIAKVYAT